MRDVHLSPAAMLIYFTHRWVIPIYHPRCRDCTPHGWTPLSPTVLSYSTPPTVAQASSELDLHRARVCPDEHARCYAHGHQLLEQQLASVRDVNLGRRKQDTRRKEKRNKKAVAVEHEILHLHVCTACIYTMVTSCCIPIPGTRKHVLLR